MSQENTPTLSEPQFLTPLSLVFMLLSQLRHGIIPAVIALVVGGKNAIPVLITTLIVFTISMIYSTFHYLTLRYRIAAADLIIDSGWIFKSHRTIPLARIQNVDLIQNILHRFFKVAEVRIQTAGGSEPEAVLRVLKLPQVEALRAGIFGGARSNSSQSNETQDAANAVSANPGAAVESLSPATSGTPVLTIPTKRLLLAGFLSDRGLLLIPVVFAIVHELDLTRRFGISLEKAILWLGQFINFFGNGKQWFTSAIVIAIGSLMVFIGLKIFSAIWYVLRFHDYQLLRQGNDLQIRCGLFTKIAASIPRDRIQFISVRRTWLGRRFGLASIRVETAGSSMKDGNDSLQVSDQWFVPVLLETDVRRIVQELRDGLEFDEAAWQWQGLSPRARKRKLRILILLSIVLMAVGGLAWFPYGIAFGIAVLIACLTLIPRKIRKTAYAVTENGIAFRQGLLLSKTSMTFFDKVQALALSSSPFDRRWKMANVLVDTTAAGPADHRIQIEMLDADTAVELHRQLGTAAGLALAGQ